MNKSKLTILFLSLWVSIGVFAQQDEWVAPEEVRDKTAPFLFSPETQKVGENIYLKNCKSCHGDIGKGNMIKLDPMPKDLASVHLAEQTDGSLYYKIVNGRGPMPSFKNVLSSSDVWNVISYIRSYHNDYVQPEPTHLTAFGGKTVVLSMEWLANKSQIKILANGKKDGTDTPAEGVEVALFAQRYFGNLKLTNNEITNNKGVALFSLPQNLPGDSIGHIKLIARVVDTENYGDVKTEQELNVGVPTHKPALNEQRAMWNVVQKAPWWITIAYPLAVIAVLSTIGYIILLVRKISLHKPSDDNQN